MPKPSWDADKGGCDRIREYLGMPSESNSKKKETLTAWLKRLEDRVEALEKDAHHHSGDPPPKPPDLGP